MEQPKKKRGRPARKKGAGGPVERERQLALAKHARQARAEKKQNELNNNLETQSKSIHNPMVDGTVVIRRKRIVQLILSGLTVEEVAQATGISNQSVREHLLAGFKDFSDIDTDKLISIHAQQFLKVAVTHDLFSRDILSEYVKAQSALATLDNLPMGQMYVVVDPTTILDSRYIYTNTKKLKNNSKGCGYVDKYVNSLLLSQKYPKEYVGKPVNKLFIRQYLVKAIIELGKELAQQHKVYVETIDRMGVPRITTGNDNNIPTPTKTEDTVGVEAVYTELGEGATIEEALESNRRVMAYWEKRRAEVGGPEKGSEKSGEGVEGGVSSGGAEKESS